MPNVQAFELEAGATVGYDDNPRLENDSAGALFSQFDINLWQTWPLAGLTSTAITLSGFANCRQYDRLNDNRQLGGGLESTTRLLRLPGSLTFFSVVSSHHNPLIDDDDFDSLELGSRLVWLARSRLSLEFAVGISWLDYRQSIISGNKKNGDEKNGDGQIGNNKNGETGQFDENSCSNPQPGIKLCRHDDSTAAAPGNQSRCHDSGERDDRLLTTAVKLFYDFSPYLDGGSEIYWHLRDSTLASEKCLVYGLGADLNWHPLINLEFSGRLGAERIPYRDDYQQQKRIEKIYLAETALTWRSGNWSISGIWSWNRRDSRIDEDDYQRNQWQSRVTYSY